MGVVLRKAPRTDTIRNQLTEWVRGQRQLIEETGSPGIVTTKRLAKLALLIEKLGDLDLDDQRLGSLADLHRLNPMKADEWQPTHGQAQVVALAGSWSANSDDPDPDELLAELIRAGITDLMQTVTQFQGKRAEQQISEARQRFTEERDTAVEQAQAKEADAKARANQSESELVAARAQIDLLKAELAGKAEATKPTAKKPAPVG